MTDKTSHSEDPTNSSIKEIDVEGCKFTVDTDKLDDVESLEFIERIENQGQVAAVLPLLKLILGIDTYRKLQEFFAAKDAADHKDKNPNDKDYVGRMRLGKLNDVYLAIIEKFDPKG